MGKVSENGLGQLDEQLALLGAKATPIAKASLYEGVRLVNDALTQAISEIKTEPFHYVPEGRTRLPSPAEKAAIENAKHGSTRMQVDGDSVEIHVGLSHAGYVDIPYGPNYTSHVAVAKIANSVNHGTSFLKKQPFMRKAMQVARTTATGVVASEIDRRFQEIFGGK